MKLDTLGSSSGLQAALVYAAIGNVPLFVLLLFLLLTRFRAQMLEDPFYVQYVDPRTDRTVSVPRSFLERARVERFREELDAMRQETALRSEDTAASTPGRYSIAINDFHPRYSELRNALREAGYRVDDIYGGVDGNDPPEKLVIFISDHVSFSYIQSLLSLVLEYGFDGIQVGEPDPIEDADIYIGSYGIREYSVVSDDLSSRIRDMEKVDFDYYLTLHRHVHRKS